LLRRDLEILLFGTAPIANILLIHPFTPTPPAIFNDMITFERCGLHLAFLSTLANSQKRSGG